MLLHDSRADPRPDPAECRPPAGAAIDAVPYASAIKVGLQFKRRFWEEDESIYGGITFTDLPIATDRLSEYRLFQRRPGVLLGAYTFGANAYQILGHARRRSACARPSSRVRRFIRSTTSEFQHGVAVAWHRCRGPGLLRPLDRRDPRRHYDDLCAIDGRIVLAGEHVSRIGGWQEGALTSALDAIGRLHQRVVAGSA